MQGFRLQGAHYLQLSDWLAEAEGIEPRYGDFELGCSRLFEMSYRIPISLAFIKPLETLEFGEPYRIRGVQSSGEKWAIWRRILPISSPELKSEIAANTWAELPTKLRRE